MPTITLTEKETRMLQAIVEHGTTEGVAAAIGVGKESVRTYLSTLYGRLKVNNMTQAAVWFLRHHQAEIEQRDRILSFAVPRRVGLLDRPRRP
jgi:DNA-binding CsgD family transcriptional regulator